MRNKKAYEKIFDQVDRNIRTSLKGSNNLDEINAQNLEVVLKSGKLDTDSLERMSKAIEKYSSLIYDFTDPEKVGNNDGPLQDETGINAKRLVKNYRTKKQLKRGLIGGFLGGMIYFGSSIISLSPPIPDYISPNPRGGPVAQYGDRIERNLQDYGKIPASIGRFIDQYVLETSTLAYTSSIVPSLVVGLAAGILTGIFYNTKKDPTTKQILFDRQKNKKIKELRQNTLDELLRS